MNIENCGFYGIRCPGLDCLIEANVAGKCPIKHSRFATLKYLSLLERMSTFYNTTSTDKHFKYTAFGLYPEKIPWEDQVKYFR